MRFSIDDLIKIEEDKCKTEIKYLKRWEYLNCDIRAGLYEEIASAKASLEYHSTIVYYLKMIECIRDDISSKAILQRKMDGDKEQIVRLIDIDSIFEKHLKGGRNANSD